MQSYIQEIPLPSLSDTSHRILEAPLTVEQLQLATSLFPNSKAQGADGIPIEVYKMYADDILPHLLSVFNEAKTSQCLPHSMSRATIVLILKPGKDLPDSGSYRPISLLQCDIKILAKVLALRLKKVIISIMHADRSGFMPQKSTAINLRRLFLSLQSPSNNVGDRALLSLTRHSIALSGPICGPL